MQIGTQGRFLYKQGSQAFTVDATVIEVKRSHLNIEFINPYGGYRHRRWLRTPAERARFSTDAAFEVKRPGGQNGNQNARKRQGPTKIAFSVSISNDRLSAATARLQASGKEINRDTLRTLVYEALDTYLS